MPTDTSGDQLYDIRAIGEGGWTGRKQYFSKLFTPSTGNSREGFCYYPCMCLCVCKWVSAHFFGKEK